MQLTLPVAFQDSRVEMNTTNNITIDPNDQLGLTSGIMFGSSAALGVVSSSASLSYIFVRLKLNLYMKILLGIMVGVSLIGCSLSAIGLVLYLFNGYFTTFACRLIGYSLIPLFHSINMLNFISILRYLMSSLAAKTRILRNWQAALFIGGACILCYGSVFAFMFWQEYNDVKSSVTLCLNEKNHMPMQPIPLALFLGKVIVIAICGLFCDASLCAFIKRRNKVGNGAKMIPWKSTKAQDANEDLQIPIKATILSFFMAFLMFLLAMGIFYLVLRAESGSKELFFWSVSSAVVLVSCGAPMGVMIFTVKDQEKKQSMGANAQPPASLNFHDEGTDHQNEPKQDVIELQEFE